MIEWKLLLPEPGRFKLTVVLMPTCWLGCDVTAPLDINVLKQTAEEKLGKGPVRGAAAKALKSDDSDDGEVRLPLCVTATLLDPRYLL